MNKILVLPYLLDPSLEEHAFLSEGILEDVIDKLSTNSKIKTVSRSTSMYIGSHPRPAITLKEEFSVDYFVEGNVRKEGDNYCITTRLVQTDTDQVIHSSKHLLYLNNWTQSIEKIVNEIIFAIGEQNVSSESTITVNHNSREAYLQGLYHWHRYTHEEITLAIGFFKKSIKADPTYSLPYSAIADCYTVIGVMGYDKPIPAFEQAKEYIEKSIALNDKSSDAYLAAAMLNLFYDLDLPKTKINLDLAYKLNKGNMKILHIYSMYYMHVDQNKLAEKCSRTTVKEEPLALPHYAQLIRALNFQRKFKEAMEVINAAYTIDPDSIALRELRGETYLHLGNIELAIEDYKFCIEQSPENYLNYGLLSFAYSSSNFHNDSRVVEQAMEASAAAKNTGVYNYGKAVMCLGRGDYDGFFKNAELALDTGLSVCLGNLFSNPLYSEIRKDTRYENIAGRFKNRIVSTTPQSKLPTSFISIQTNTKEEVTIDPQDICYVQSEDNYCTLYWHESGVLKNRMLRVTISQLEKQFESVTYLYRCHKSFIINKNQDLTLTGNAKGYFFESPFIAIRIPVSRSKNSEVKAFM